MIRNAPLTAHHAPQTFLFAGHETISNSLSWVLWALVCAPEKQDRLRREVREARRKALVDGRDELTSEDLSSLEYLDAVTVSHCRD